MTNIEAMTIGAKARLQHLLDVDVARHLREMSRSIEKPWTFSQEAMALLQNSPVVFVAGGAAGPAISTAVGGAGGSFVSTSGCSAQWVRPINKQEAV